jgi:hypothetical protein
LKILLWRTRKRKRWKFSTLDTCIAQVIFIVNVFQWKRVRKTFSMVFMLHCLHCERKFYQVFENDMFNSSKLWVIRFIFAYLPFRVRIRMKENSSCWHIIDKHLFFFKSKNKKHRHSNACMICLPAQKLFSPKKSCIWHSYWFIAAWFLRVSFVVKIWRARFDQNMIYYCQKYVLEADIIS